MNNEKILGFKRNHAGGDEKLVVNKCWPNHVNQYNACAAMLTPIDSDDCACSDSQHS